MRQLETRKYPKCQPCNGFGYVVNKLTGATKKCSVCNGTGRSG